MSKIKVKGRDYLPVGDRITMFHEKYETGSISTSIVSNDERGCLVRAVVLPDAGFVERRFTGHACEVQDNKSQVNKKSFVENAETSAIGRALVAAGFPGSEMGDSVDAGEPPPKTGVEKHFEDTRAARAKVDLLHEYHNRGGNKKVFACWLIDKGHTTALGPVKTVKDAIAVVKTVPDDLVPKILANMDKIKEKLEPKKE